MSDREIATFSWDEINKVTVFQGFFRFWDFRVIWLHTTNCSWSFIWNSEGGTFLASPTVNTQVSHWCYSRLSVWVTRHIGQTSAHGRRQRGQNAENRAWLNWVKDFTSGCSSDSAFTLTAASGGTSSPSRRAWIRAGAKQVTAPRCWFACMTLHSSSANSGVLGYICTRAEHGHLGHQLFKVCGRRSVLDNALSREMACACHRTLNALVRAGCQRQAALWTDLPWASDSGFSGNWALQIEWEHEATLTPTVTF